MPYFFNGACSNMKMRVAILVDGDFFIKRHCSYFNKEISKTSAADIAKCLKIHCMKHIRDDKEMLYRIFFYDCKPITKKAHYPFSHRSLDLAKSDTAIFRNELHKELTRTSCLALRFGYLDEKNASWQIKDEKTYHDILSKKKDFNSLTDDLVYKAKQKGVDMRIGLDIATLSYKKLVDKIVLISGDSDFVPAAKLARREGLFFILDPMGNDIKEDLQEHIDWLTTTLPNFKKKK